MHFILDNLLATLIAGFLFLTLVSLHQQRQVAAVEVMSFYRLKQQQKDFIELLKRDMQGAAKLVNVTEDLSDSTFAFDAQASPTDATLRRIVYKRRHAGRRDSTDFYQVQRLVDGQPDGASMPTMTGWEIIAKNREGGAIQNLADGEQVHIQFEAAMPFKEGETIKRTRWQTTFYPPLLRQLKSL